MPSDLSLIGWKASGLRCPDHEVSFLRDSGDEVFPISLVQMPNGTGKTTTLELLRAALSGDALSWSAEQVRQYEKRQTGAGNGLFQATLLFGRRRITFTMDFDFAGGEVHYRTTEERGEDPGFNPPRELSPFLRAEFIRFFVFDGELASHLLDEQYTDAQRVIEDLFGLRVLFSISQRIQAYWDEEAGRRQATEEKGLTRRRNALQKLRRRLAFLQKERAATLKSLEDQKDELARRQRKYEEGLTAFSEANDRLVELRSSMGECRVELRSMVDTMFDKMREPQSLTPLFLKDIRSLRGSLDRAKLPRSSSKEFFEEVALEDICICGRELDDSLREVIRKRASFYLSSDDTGLLNALKADIAEIRGEEPDELKELSAQVVGLAERQMEINAEISEVESHAVMNDPKLRQEKERIDLLESEIGSLEEKLAKYDEPSDPSRNDDSVQSIKEIKKRLEKAEQLYAEITDTIRTKKQADSVRRIIATAHDKAKLAISSDICMESNSRMERLMPANHIRIREVDQCLRLENQAGASAGETLSVGYAFLSTLFSRSQHRIPFIVDSPAGPLDHSTRRNVGPLIPRLTHQFVAFTISTERPGFLDSIEGSQRQADIQYLTLFRKGLLDRSQYQDYHHSETVDGVQVDERDYFHSFQLEEE